MSKAILLCVFALMLSRVGSGNLPIVNQRIKSSTTLRVPTYFLSAEAVQCLRGGKQVADDDNGGEEMTDDRDDRDRERRTPSPGVTFARRDEGASQRWGGGRPYDGGGGTGARHASYGQMHDAPRGSGNRYEDPGRRDVHKGKHWEHWEGHGRASGRDDGSGGNKAGGTYHGNRDHVQRREPARPQADGPGRWAEDRFMDLGSSSFVRGQPMGKQHRGQRERWDVQDEYSQSEQTELPPQRGPDALRHMADGNGRATQREGSRYHEQDDYHKMHQREQARSTRDQGTRYGQGTRTADTREGFASRRADVRQQWRSDPGRRGMPEPHYGGTHPPPKTSANAGMSDHESSFMNDQGGRSRYQRGGELDREERVEARMPRTVHGKHGSQDQTRRDEHRDKDGSMAKQVNGREDHDEWYECKSEEDIHEDDIANLAEGIGESHAETFEKDWQDAREMAEAEDDDDDEDVDEEPKARTSRQAETERMFEAHQAGPSVQAKRQENDEVMTQAKVRHEFDELDQQFEKEFEKKAVGRFESKEKDDDDAAGAPRAARKSSRSDKPPASFRAPVPGQGQPAPTGLKLHFDGRDVADVYIYGQDDAGDDVYQKQQVPRRDDAAFAAHDAALISEIQALLSKGNADGAEDLLMKELEQRPSSPHVLRMYAEFLWIERDDVDAAGELFDQLVESSPGDLVAVCLRANFLWRAKGDAENALAAYQVASFLPGADAEVFHSMALIHQLLVRSLCSLLLSCFVVQFQMCECPSIIVTRAHSERNTRSKSKQWSDCLARDHGFCQSTESQERCMIMTNQDARACWRICDIIGHECKRSVLSVLAHHCIHVRQPRAGCSSPGRAARFEGLIAYRRGQRRSVHKQPSSGCFRARTSYVHVHAVVMWWACRPRRGAAGRARLPRSCTARPWTWSRKVSTLWSTSPCCSTKKSATSPRRKHCLCARYASGDK
jgi:hypothetical protein